MKQLFFIFILALLSLSVFNCTNRLASFAAVSNKNVNIKVQENTAKKVTGSISYFFLFAPFFYSPAIGEVVNDALNNAGPGYTIIMNASVVDKWGFPGIFHTMEVTGYAYKQ